MARDTGARPLSGLASNTTWAVVVIVLVPMAIVALAELDERLRQRDSVFRRAVGTARAWVLPLFALWAVVVPVLGTDTSEPFVRITASLLVLGIAVVLLQIIRLVVADIRTRDQSDARTSIPELVLAMPRIALIAATVWILLDSVWGVDLSAAFTALGVTSLVVSFALQDTLSGLASGVLLLGDRPFTPGDWIRAGDVEGVVIDINWRATRIRDRDGDMLIVPNGQLASATVVNFSSPDRFHRVSVELQVAFVNSPTAAREMLLSAAKATRGVMSDPPPDVRVVQIDDPLMGYAVDMWIDDYAIAPRVRSEFGALVWYHSHRHGVPLPSPAQDLFIHEGDAPPPPLMTSDEIRVGLRRSVVLAELPDLDLERMAESVRAAGYGIGEVIDDSRAPTGSLSVLASGRAQLVLIDEDAPEAVIADLAPGDIIGLLINDAPDGHVVVLRALTDCTLLHVDAEVASEMSSRHLQLSAAVNRTVSIRRRRVERIVHQRDRGDATHASDAADRKGGEA